MPLPTVYVTTWCQDERLLYGSTLVFDTIRVGYPNARVVVLENGSIPAARAAVVDAARASGCEIRLLETERPHWKIIETLCLSEERPFVILDPDIALWESVEQWEFGGALMAGRFLAACEPGKDRLVPRLHTSHLWFPDPSRLRDRIASVTAGGASVSSLFEGGCAPGRLRWDTADILCLTLGDEAVPFTEGQLDAYDHLFGSSYLPVLQSGIDSDMAGAVGAWHASAREDYRSLRGVWRKQEALLHSAPWRTDLPEQVWKSALLDHALRRPAGRLARLGARLGLR